MAQHALLSASSSKRWLTCTPSARLEERFPNKSSPFALEGTAMHELCEYRIRKYLHERVKRPQSDFYTEEVEKCVEAYYQFVVDIVERERMKGGDPTVLVETHLDYSNYAPSGFGTGDCLVIADGTLHVIDFKGGRGVFVDADHNTQMMLYGLGALNGYDFLYDITDVEMSIVQPRLNNISTFKMTAADLVKWGEEYVKPRALLAYKGEGEQVPGDHCKFCRAKAVCKANADLALSLAADEFAEYLGTQMTDSGAAVPQFRFKGPGTISHDEIEEILPVLNQIQGWIDSVFAFVTEEAINHGVTWRGYKVVEGRANRKFIDEKKVEAAAIKAGYYDIYKKTLLTLTEFEKLMGKKNFQRILGDQVYKPPGKLSLVPESDKRPAVDPGGKPADGAAETFTADDWKDLDV